MIHGPRLAYEEHRPYPRFQTIRPITSGGSSAVALLHSTGWAQIKKASADSTFLNGSSLTSYSNLINDYDGTASNAEKSVVMFDQGLDASTDWLLPIFEGDQALNGQVTYTNTNAVHNPTITNTLRIRPITAPYNISALTWNSFQATPPTMGTAITFDTMTGDTQGKIDGTDGTVPGIFMGFYSAIQPLKLNVPSLFYGFVIDCKTNLSDNGSPVISSSKAILNAPIAKTTFASVDYPAIYAVKMNYLDFP